MEALRYTYSIRLFLPCNSRMDRRFPFNDLPLPVSNIHCVFGDRMYTQHDQFEDSLVFLYRQNIRRTGNVGGGLGISNFAPYSRPSLPAAVAMDSDWDEEVSSNLHVGEAE